MKTMRIKRLPISFTIAISLTMALLALLTAQPAAAQEPGWFIEVVASAGNVGGYTSLALGVHRALHSPHQLL